MTLHSHLPSRGSPPLRGRAQAVCRHDVLALLGLGLVIGLACRGHFAMPHPDFLEFLDSGHAWLRGELPPTLKRAPLYPLLVVGLGKLLPVEAADRVVAEWLNVLLLPLNALLVYLIGRQWFGAGARWAATWFLLLPVGMYCTAHVIVEPLLTGLILLTILLVRRGGVWPYIAAAAATMARYDAAGLILGVGLAALLRRRPLRQTIVRTGLAAAPLVLWLILTALTWSGRSEDHYLVQIADKPGFDLRWAATNLLARCFDPELLRVPAWGWLPDALLRYVVLVPVALALAGIVIKLRCRDPVVVAALIAMACYLVAHAVFPFHEDRFGYPPAPVLLLFVGPGLHAAGGWLKPIDPRGTVGRVLLLLAGLMLAWALISEARAFATAVGGVDRLMGRLGLLVLVAIVALWAAPLVYRSRRLAQIVLLLGITLLLTRQTGNAAVLLGTGQDLRNQVEAARWIRRNAPPDARVLSASPGLLRLYVGRDPPDRFLGFQDIQSQTWDEIIAECRRRRIDYIIWHDQLYQEHGGYYAGKWGLSRFAPLAAPETAPGVHPERRFAKHPDLVIVRVVPETSMKRTMSSERYKDSGKMSPHIPVAVGVGRSCTSQPSPWRLSLCHLPQIP